MTVGGRSGVSANANTSSPAAAASKWLSTVGLTASNGKDIVLHSGEGSISAIKWSSSGKYVAWVNEQGIKIMRSNIRLGNFETESAWKRIGHVPKPPRAIWEEMGGLWKAQVAWIDDECLMVDDKDPPTRSSTTSDGQRPEKSRQSSAARPKERLLVGWGDTVWILEVQHGGKGTGKDVGEQLTSSANITHM